MSTSKGFNGAAFNPWNQERRRGVRDDLLLQLLQWGYGIRAVESGLGKVAVKQTSLVILRTPRFSRHMNNPGYEAPHMPLAGELIVTRHDDSKDETGSIVIFT